MTRPFLISTLFVIFALGMDLVIMGSSNLSELLPAFSNGFDWRKFLLWLIFPIILYRLLKLPQKISFSFNEIQKKDWLIILFISLLAGLSMLLIPHIDALNQYYVQRGEVSFEQKIAFIKFQSLWIFSWAFGWEYLIRFFWLNSFEERHLSKAIYILPIIEVLYHFNKPWPEILGVLALSLFLVGWTIKRRNMLPAMLTHLLIEFILIFYLII